MAGWRPTGFSPRWGRKGDILPCHVPTWYPKSTLGNLCMLLACTTITAATQGYDVAMMGGMNIIPQYTRYFALSPAIRSLNVATNYIGGCLACLVWGWMSDAYGRRVGLFWAAAITVLAAVLQGAAQSVAMFCVARVLIGFGTTASVITGPAYLAETLPWDLRAWGLALFDDLYYVGALIAAGVTAASFRLDSTWAWRLPSLLQGVWGLACIVLLPWMPESPRWLVDQGRKRDALAVLARVNAGGDDGDDLVRLQFCEICDTLRYEREPMTWRQMLSSYGARKRLIITFSCALFSMTLGNVFVKYNIGKILAYAGVESLEAQLHLNVGLHGLSLVCALIGSYFVDRLGAKFIAMISTSAAAVTLVVLGIMMQQFGDSFSGAATTASVAMVFVFQGVVAFGWVPILFMVPAEMLNFSIRSQGMSAFSMIVNLTGIWGNFAFPVALDRLGWRLYLLNAGWNAAVAAFIALAWVEVQGKTLEEIDALFDGVKHSSVPNVGDVIRGVAKEEGWRERVASLVKMWNRNGGEAGDAAAGAGVVVDAAATPRRERCRQRAEGGGGGGSRKTRGGGGGGGVAVWVHSASTTIVDPTKEAERRSSSPTEVVFNRRVELAGEGTEEDD